MNIADKTIEIEANLPLGGHAKFASTFLGENSGLSHHDIGVAHKLARLDDAEFEKIVESDTPPTRHGIREGGYKRPDTRKQERLESHLRVLVILFRKLPPDNFEPVKNVGDLHCVRENIVKLR